MFLWERLFFPIAFIHQENLIWSFQLWEKDDGDTKDAYFCSIYLNKNISGASFTNSNWQPALGLCYGMDK